MRLDVSLRCLMADHLATRTRRDLIFPPRCLWAIGVFGRVPITAHSSVNTYILVRTLRVARSVDFQKLVHKNMRGHFAAYPKQWGLSKPDRNIDHRRVPNLHAFFKRRGCELKLPQTGDFAAFLPGDIVTCTVPPNLPHVMIVSDRKSPSGTPLVIHNIGGGACEEDALQSFPITGHYRWK